ncbi:hypothetical protein SUGI_0025730 [Cryptomeria japonica]|nr:hypothetical protein SUGI_0025730 [Cryptomeria japonica]
MYEYLEFESYSVNRRFSVYDALDISLLCCKIENKNAARFLRVKDNYPLPDFCRPQKYWGQRTMHPFSGFNRHPSWISIGHTITGDRYLKDEEDEVS